MKLIRDPEPMPPADYLIMGSTYGGRLHKDVSHLINKLRDVVVRAAARGGRIIVPAFAVGRTQQLVLRLHPLVSDSKKLNDVHGPFVVISASGMCEQGRILHHLRNNIRDPRNTVLIHGIYGAGHARPETGGEKQGSADFGRAHAGAGGDFESRRAERSRRSAGADTVDRADGADVAQGFPGPRGAAAG